MILMDQEQEEGNNADPDDDLALDQLDTVKHSAAGKMFSWEGTSTVQSNNAFLMEDSIVDTKRTARRIVTDNDIDSGFEVQDVVVKKIKDKQKKDMSKWWKDQFGMPAKEKQPSYLKDHTPDPSLLPVK